MNTPTSPSILQLKSHALSLFNTGITAADPYLAVQSCLSVEDQQLKLLLNSDDKTLYRTENWSKVHLIAFGKAACAMIKAAQEMIPAHLRSGIAIAVTNDENGTAIDGIEVISASHPLPDDRGLKAAIKCADYASLAQKNELVLVLISGGGSALIPYPVDSISLPDKITTTQLLLASGTTIQQINCVRKHLSQLKGGGLARLAAPADLHALILSDVLDDDLSAIASGPTVADATTFGDAINIIKAYSLWNKIPLSVQKHLELGLHGQALETPKPGEPVFANTTHTLIGSNALSLKAVFKAAQALGYHTIIYNKQLCGEAKQVAETWAQDAKQCLENAIDKPLALLAGGETTVTLTGNGRGGRNQEMALAFAIAAEKHELDNNWIFLSGGTDGRDGPTDAAGGITDSNTLKRIRNAGLDPLAMLNNNDSYTALKNSNDLIMTGATGTNVADLQILLIYPHS
ncbi:MAG: glycerate kinase [Methylococcales bacterium]|nr:MAG: glycerate kinase [Methylococcales bacterium]